LFSRILSDCRDMGYRFFRDDILANGDTLEPFISGLITIIKNDRYIPVFVT